MRPVAKKLARVQPYSASSRAQAVPAQENEEKARSPWQRVVRRPPFYWSMEPLKGDRRTSLSVRPVPKNVR